MSINKIVFFIVERALVENGELLTDAKIEAWEHGPVFRELYHAFKEFKDCQVVGGAKSFDPISRCMIEAQGNFSSDDVGLFEEVLEQYLGLTAAQLRALSHRQDGPWYKVWWHETKVNPGMEITSETILSANSSEQIQ